MSCCVRRYDGESDGNAMKQWACGRSMKDLKVAPCQRLGHSCQHASRGDRTLPREYYSCRFHGQRQIQHRPPACASTGLPVSGYRPVNCRSYRVGHRHHLHLARRARVPRSRNQRFNLDQSLAPLRRRDRWRRRASRPKP